MRPRGSVFRARDAEGGSDREGLILPSPRARRKISEPSWRLEFAGRQEIARCPPPAVGIPNDVHISRSGSSMQDHFGIRTGPESRTVVMERRRMSLRIGLRSACCIDVERAVHKKRLDQAVKDWVDERESPRSGFVGRWLNRSG